MKSCFTYIFEIEHRTNLPFKVKECIGMATAYVLVNGSPTDEFSFERELC